MKYLVNREFRPENMEKVFNKFGEYLKDHEKNPGKYPEFLWPCHAFAGQSKGFSLVEATPEQINNEIFYWNPLLKLNFNPIIEVSKLV